MKKVLLALAALVFFFGFVNAQMVVNLGTDRETCGAMSLGNWNTVTGGTPPYQYQWTSLPPGFTSNQLYVNVNAADTTTYILAVTDSLGQQATDSVTLTFNPPLQWNIQYPLGGDTIVCVNNIFQVRCTISGGVPPYTFAWGFGIPNSTYDTAQNPQVVFPQTGTFFFQGHVHDSRACNYGTGGEYVQVIQNCAPFHISKDDACFSTCTGSAGITAQPAGNYRYHWSTGDTTASISNLCAGTYYVTVTDSLFNPIDTFGTIISKKEPALFNVFPSNVRCMGANNGSGYTNTPWSGVSPYTYLWSNGSTTRSTGQVGPGVYILSVKDGKRFVNTETTIKN